MNKNIQPQKDLLNAIDLLLTSNLSEKIKVVLVKLDRAQRIYQDLIYADQLIKQHQIDDPQASHRSQTINSAKWMFGGK